MSRSKIESFYSYSLSQKSKFLEPTQLSKADRFQIQFGNFEKGFKEKKEFLFPPKAKLVKDKIKYISKITRAYEKKRKNRNLLAKQKRATKLIIEKEKKIPKQKFKNYFSFSLSSGKKLLNPTQFAKADRVFVHFGNEYKGFREITEIIFPDKLKISKRKQNFITRILKDHEKKRQLRNQLAREKRLRKFVLSPAQEKVHQQKLSRIIEATEDHYAYSLTGKSGNQINSDNFKDATSFTIYHGSKGDYQEEYTKNFPPKRRTPSQKEDFLNLNIDKSENEVAKSYEQYQKEYFPQDERTKVIGVREESDRTYISVMKELSGLGSGRVLTVRQEYVFYTDPKHLNPYDKLEYEENKKLITTDSLPLASKLLKIKNKSNDYIFRVLLTMKNAEGQEMTQGFSDVRQLNVKDTERFTRIFSETADYFTTKEGSKYLSLYNTFQLNGYMLERIVAKV